MGNQMQQAFANQKGGGGTRHTSSAAPTMAQKPKKSGADIIRELAEKRTSREAMAKAMEKTAEAVTEHDARAEEVYARFDANSQLMETINGLNKQKGRHQRGSEADQRRQDELQAATEGLEIVRGEMEEFRTKYPLAFEEALQR